MNGPLRWVQGEEGFVLRGWALALIPELSGQRAKVQGEEGVGFRCQGLGRRLQGFG